MDVGDTLALLMLGLVVLGLAWVASELQAMRRDLEPLVNSPLARGIASLGG